MKRSRLFVISILVVSVLLVLFDLPFPFNASINRSHIPFLSDPTKEQSPIQVPLIRPYKLGLDLQGGARLTYDLKMDSIPEANKQDALDVFKMFWGNPGYGIDGKPGVTTSFNYSDVDFFLLDNRYNRTPNDRKNGDRTILGKDQLEWLIDVLVSSKATFKIVCMGGQFLNSSKVLENYANYEAERQWILDQLELEKISGVIFLSGDRHSTELDIMPREKSYPLHEFTISSLTAGPSTYALKENNIFRQEGTLLTERNFTRISVSGKKKERILKCTVYNVAGEEKWSYSIKESDLRYPGK